MVQIKEIYKKASQKIPAEVYEEKIKQLRKEYEKPVKGMFEFLDAQGGWLDFCYRFFPGEPVQQIRLIHGEICELPMGIVKHLNNTKKKIRRFGLTMGNGASQMDGELPHRGLPSSYETQSRVRFTPTEMF